MNDNKRNNNNNYVLYILVPTARWRPIPLTSSLGEFQTIGTTARVGVHRLFPFRLPYLGVSPFTLNLPLDFISVSSLRPTYLQF